MDANRWLLGLILAFEMQVRREIDELMLAAKEFAGNVEDGSPVEIEITRNNALASVRFIYRQCDTLQRLTALGPESIQPTAVTG